MEDCSLARRFAARPMFRAVTIHAAGQIGMANQLGTLESGKLADLTILEQDPYEVDPDA